MELQDALKAIHAPKGQTTVIHSILTGDFDPIREQNAVGASLADAEEHLREAEEAQNNCKSDAAYWGYMGDISYWCAVVNILKAAEITGANNLPDVPLPDNSPAVVMDMCARIQKFGEAVLEAAEQTQPA